MLSLLTPITFLLVCNMKELIFNAYETGKLIAVIPFVAKVLEASAKSKIFAPPNVWVMALMRLLAEIYHIPELKLNLKFEIELLCQHLELDLTGTHMSHFNCIGLFLPLSTFLCRDKAH